MQCFPCATVATALTGGAAHACGVVRLLTLVLIACLSLLLQDFKSEALESTVPCLDMHCCALSLHITKYCALTGELSWRDKFRDHMLCRAAMLSPWHLTKKHKHAAFTCFRFA